MSELDVEELLKSELAKVRTPKAPPLKQFHAMLEHTMKLLPDIDDIVSAADKKDVQLRDAQAANNELIAQLEGVLGEQEEKDERVKSLELDLSRITLRRDEAIQANQELVNAAAAYKRDKNSAEKKLAELSLDLVKAERVAKELREEFDRRYAEAESVADELDETKAKLNSRSRQLDDAHLSLQQLKRARTNWCEERDMLYVACTAYASSPAYFLGCILTFPFRCFTGQVLFPVLH